MNVEEKISMLKKIKLKDRLRKKFGDTKQTALDYKLILLKYDLNTTSEKIKHQRSKQKICL